MNWVPAPNGVLQLRYGYTRVPTNGNFSGNLHSAAYIQPNSGTAFVLGGTGTQVAKLSVDSIGEVVVVGQLASGDPWNGIFADDKFMFGNAQDAKWYDGETLRTMGVRSFTDTEAAGVSVSYTTVSAGTWSTTLFSGYQLYACFYNPITEECGNRTLIGQRFTVPDPDGVVQITGLPTPENSEWVVLLGRTNDNGMVPNAFIGSDGNYVVASGTTASIVLDTTDPESELPTRNGLPPRFNKIAWALSRAYAIDEDDPSGIRYSESQADVPSGLFVGDPRTSWAPNSKVYFPTGERCRALHEVDNNVWVWSRNHLAILTEFGGTDSGLGRATVQWVGNWVGGIAGQRAFAKTRYGPFWVSAEKQLMTGGGTASSPVPVSTQYESALLARIADKNVPNIEVTYFADPAKDLDCLYIWGLDSSGHDVFIVHDFGAGGIGREHAYTGLHISTFVRNPQTIVSACDLNDKSRLWVSGNASVWQLEDSDSDNTQTYSADIITVFNAGPLKPSIGALEFFGDKNIEFTFTDDFTLTLEGLDALESIDVDEVDEKTALYKVEIEGKRQYWLMRVQLESHPQDGTLAPSAPVPHIPLETYGRLYLSRPQLGAPRTIGGANP